MQELTSPAVYRLSRGYTLGIAVTASHDSADGVTGLKVAQDGLPWVPDDYDAVDQGGTILQPLRPSGLNLRNKDERHAYRRCITSGASGFYVRFSRKLAVLGGSNVATQLAYEVLSDIGLNVFAETHHGLDPSQPQDLPFDDAILIDADGDRLGLIWNGTWRSPAELTIADIGSLAAVAGTQAGALLFDLRAPASVLAAARAHGFKVDFSPGGRWMNLAVATPAYLYGAEVSGHRYWQAFSGADCAIFGALRALGTYIPADPKDPLTLEDAPIEKRGYDASMLESTLPSMPDDWLQYVLPENQGWRVDHPLEEGWLCCRTASDGKVALTASGAGVELLP